jgi:branched-chain amino acid transport system permease protein
MSLSGNDVNTERRIMTLLSIGQGRQMMAQKGYIAGGRWRVAACIAAVVLFPFIASQFGNSWVRIVDMALLYIMLALGLNIIVGFTGLLDLGYIAFYAIGAYTAAAFASPQFAALLASVINTYPEVYASVVWLFGKQVIQHGLHLSLWWVMLLAMLITALFGVLRGLTMVKLRGDYLAIVTLGFAEIVRIFLGNLDRPFNFTNGPQGINMIDPIRVFGVSLAGEPGSGSAVRLFGMSLPSVNAYYFLFLAVSLLIVWISTRLRDSRIGRAWIAIREDELAAQTMGIHTRNMKLLASAVGAAFAGIAGTMFAAFQGFVSPESFTMNESIIVLAMVVLGGIGHIPGVVLGGLLLAGLPELLRHVVEPVQLMLFDRVWVDAEVLRQLMYGMAMVGIMLIRPAGLWPAPQAQNVAVKPADGA